jgi:magnesium-transporting ATPase (P-type)
MRNSGKAIGTDREEKNMERKWYRFIWWILAAAVLAGIISYLLIHNQTKTDYLDGTLVWLDANEAVCCGYIGDTERNTI